MGRNIRVSVVGVVAVATALVVAACAPQAPPNGNSSRFLQIDPAITGPGIPHETVASHFAISPYGTPRNQLIVLFNGTGAGPLALHTLGETLAGDGFHVIALRYSSDVGTTTACPDSVAQTDPDCFRRFRGEVVHGEGVTDPSGASYDHASVSVSAANSVENRLLKLVDHLRTTRALDGWGQFQQVSDGACTTMNTAYGTCELDWTKVIAGGHSQGAGVALYLAKFHPLARVMLYSGPFDVFELPDASLNVAPWITEAPLQVPSSRITLLSHTGDLALDRFEAVEAVLGLPGSPVEITNTARPYDGSSRLRTSATPTCPLGDLPKHNSTATEGCSPFGVLNPVWRYMASGN
jgi:predicted esterase